MEIALIKSLIISLSLIIFHPPCAFGGNDLCFSDSGDPSTAPIAPSLEDASGTDEDFVVNDEVVLYCCFTSKHPVQVKWYKDDIPLTTGARYQLGENNQVLSIAKGSKLDNGAYRCEGSNQHGRQAWNITVFMHLPQCQHAPTVFTPKATVAVKKGKSATLTCIVQSKEDCSLTSTTFFWRNAKGRIVMKNAKFVPSGGSNVDVRMTLTVKHAKKHKAGAYKCITQNARTKVSSSVWLNVV